MDNLNRSQFILLVLLVCFVVSIFTAIITATLVAQEPAPFTQTINKVIEKTVETVSQDIKSGKTIVVTQEQQVIKLVEDLSPAVVSVVATKDLPVIERYYVNPFENDDFFKNFFPSELLPQFEVPQYRQKGTEKKEVGSGTGFFVSKDGFLLTNRHVVIDETAEYSVILNNGQHLPAKVLARDPVQDVAVLKIQGDNFSFIPLGDSDKIKVGQTVIAIGNSLGEFQNTVSVGVISGLNRSLVASDSSGGYSEQLQEVIQTDAAINPGNSGGPLLNLDGQAVGINTAVAQGAENIGFSLPINLMKRALADVKEFGKIRYAYLGVRYQVINEKLKEEKKLSVDYGALVVSGTKGESAIMKDSPAEKAGLKEGDIILEFNGAKIDGSHPLSKLITNGRVGEIIKLKVLRSGRELELTATLDERPKIL